jgi:hypothetical protein
VKFLQLLFRAGLGVAIGLIFSFSSATIFFDASGYKTIDSAFLILVPALAIAYLFFESFPTLQKWMEQARIATLIILGALALLGAGSIVLPLATSPVYYPAALAVTLLLYAAMLPAVRFIETADISLNQYSFAFALSLIFVYGAVGFLDEVLKTSFGVALFTFILIPLCSVFGYYLVRRAARSFQDGFLHKPLNIVLCLALPFLFIAILWISAQFPAMFLWEYIVIPQNLSGIYFASAFVSGVWGIAALDQIKSCGYYQKIRESELFTFIKENLPGLYAGGMFFLINLIIARALNHPAFSYNSVVFETDAGPWMSILGSPASDAINRSVHPLVLITSRPLIRLVGVFMGEQWNLAPILVAAALSGSCVLMAWLFVKRATGADTYSFIFAIFLGSTSTHLLFGSLTENYVFGMTSLIFFLLLIQAGEKRLSRLVPMGVVVFGITVTNIAQTAIGLFFNKFGFWKTARYCFLVLTFGVALTVFTSVLYPNAQTFFFVPADLAFEGNFVKPAYESRLASVKEKLQVVTRAMFLYEVVAPDPLIVISQKKTDPFPTIDLKTFDWREHKLASYKGLRNIPLAIWLVFLAGAFIFFIKNARQSRHLPLMLGLLGCLAFNFLMHTTYGTELFLYTPYWVYALIFFTALAYSELSHKKWFEFSLALLAVIIAVNNLWFIFVILRALAPFFASS